MIPRVLCISRIHTNSTKIESVELKEPLDDKALQVVESLMVLSFTDIASSLHVLWCVWCPPFSYPHLDFELQYLVEELVLAFPCISSFGLQATGP